MGSVGTPDERWRNHALAELVEDLASTGQLAQIFRSSLAPEDRLEVVWQAYERDAGSRVGRPPTNAERVAVEAWLRRNKAGTLWLSEFGVYETLRQKASLAVQRPCGVCERAEGSPVFHKVVWHEPWTHQSDIARSKGIKRAIQRALVPTASEWAKEAELPVCLSVVAIQSDSTKTKDADNLVKGLLDSLQDVLYSNDRQVHCLTSRRFETAAPFGYYLVNAAFVRPWMADVVLDATDAPLINAHKIEVRSADY